MQNSGETGEQSGQNKHRLGALHSGTFDPEAKENVRRDLQPLRRLMPFLLKYPWQLVFAVVALLIATVAQLAIPAVAGAVVDEGFVSRNLEAVTQYGWLMFSVAAVMAAAGGARYYFISIIGERVITDIRSQVFSHLLSLDADFFDSVRVGELTSRLNGDVTVVRSAVGANASIALRSLLTVIGAVVMMVITSPTLALGVIIGAPVLILPILYFARRVRRMSRKAQDALANLNAMATEMLAASKTVKTFGQEDTQAGYFNDWAEESLDAEARRLIARSFLVAITMFLGIGGVLLLIWAGTVAVFNGSVSAGELTQFLVYALLGAGALLNLSEMLSTVQVLAGSIERIVELLDTESGMKVRPDPIPLPNPPLGVVKFEDVSFSYRSREKEQVLHHLDMEVAAGQTVALVGASGAGKSTVFGLLHRFYDVTGGRVLVDGVDVRDADLAELRARFAYVEQESTLFAGTVEENIRFAKPTASDAEVHAAAEAALVGEFVRGLERGYKSIVGERGVLLSGGQKQRIAIARALLKDAPILLLDEATSSLDAQSEALVQQALERLMEGRTTLVIAHRLATIRHADKILVLEDGNLIDKGTHDELVAKGGRYAELARLQFRPDHLPSELAETAK
jgi:ATP-binding cassette subfamily B protein